MVVLVSSMEFRMLSVEGKKVVVLWSLPMVHNSKVCWLLSHGSEPPAKQGCYREQRPCTDRNREGYKESTSAGWLVLMHGAAIYKCAGTAEKGQGN